jgi:hypothetical protein
MRIATAALLALTIGCGSTASDLRPETVDPEAQACETDGRPAVAHYSQTLTLAAALPTTAGAVAHWEYTRNGPDGPRPLVSRWSSLPAGSKVTFCYFDGDFANFSPPGPRGALRLHERALVILGHGQGPWLDFIGPRATNPLSAP